MLKKAIEGLRPLKEAIGQSQVKTYSINFSEFLEWFTSMQYTKTFSSAFALPTRSIEPCYI